MNLRYVVWSCAIRGIFFVVSYGPYGPLRRPYGVHGGPNRCTLAPGQSRRFSCFSDLTQLQRTTDDLICVVCDQYYTEIGHAIGEANARHFGATQLVLNAAGTICGSRTHSRKPARCLFQSSTVQGGCGERWRPRCFSWERSDLTFR